MKPMRSLLNTLCVLCALYHGLSAAVQTTGSKPSIKTSVSSVLNRSVLTIVRFLNIPCSSASGQMSGLCYSLHDCVRLHGTQIGRCASGFGVCCIFQRTCGMSTHQNFTHFTNPGFPEALSQSHSDCTLSVKKQPNICQLRLDFMDFELTAPTDGDCLDDRLTVTGSNKNAPVPELCGINTGQSIYIDVDDSPGPVKINVNTKGLGKRLWNIKVSMIECNNPSKAPPNCLQYFTEHEGRFTSFNEARGYLNNLDYAVCFRRGAGKCSITYMAESPTSFQLLNLDTSGAPTVPAGRAGRGPDSCPQDYVRLAGERYCGARLALDGGTQNMPITDSSSGPFIVSVKTDSAINADGFALNFKQNPCTR